MQTVVLTTTVKLTVLIERTPVLSFLLRSTGWSKIFSGQDSIENVPKIIKKRLSLFTIEDLR